MSSGRTAGVMCRTTIRSIAHPASCPLRHAGQLQLSTAARASTAGYPCWSAARPRAGRGQERRTAGRRRPGDARQHDPHSDASSASEAARRQVNDLDHVDPVRQGRVEPRALGAAPAPVSAISRYSASLATPVGAPPAYEIFGWGENPRNSDRQPGLPHSALDRTGEVPVARETHPAPLGVPVPSRWRPARAAGRRRRRASTLRSCRFIRS